jgi:hypothetical protein
MFHDVLLLGKGGQTVYLGPSEKALEYFEGLGFACPDRTNPADFFMDVIAGDVKRRGEKEKFDPSRLFKMWTRHQEKITPRDTPNPSEVDKNIIVSHRSQASCCKMLYLFVRRAFTQQGRHPLDVVIDNMFVIVAAFFLGISFTSRPWWEPPQPKSNFIGCPTPIITTLQDMTVTFTDQILVRASMTLMAIGLAGSASAVRIFGRERVVYFRECAGIAQPQGSIAYFFAKDIASWPQILVGTFFFQLMFKALASPLMNNTQVFLCLLPIYYCAYGVGMFVSIVVPPNLAQLCGFVFVFVNQLYSGTLTPIPQMKNDVFPLNSLYHLSFMRYGAENFYITEAVRHRDVSDSLGVDMAKTIQSSFGFSFGSFSGNICVLFLWGFLLRLITCIVMTLKDKTKKL